MIITDPIADMITRIKNAFTRKHKNVIIPHSKKKERILQIFLDEGYIKGFTVSGEVKKEINVELKYKGNTSSIVGIKRVSKPSLRVYSSASDLPKIVSGYGTVIVSTSKGLLTDKQARKENVGGEIIAYIW
ncbi:30S ribosomal protein S8 [Mesomycoplasma hyorhinis]|uniref:Small ribosomal subunit protein uS8 n=3 Tax=Mesomycoplasma hyorhinis TaxID=2100 RepID=A0AAJ3D787_MESHY|nr:MULTISPECIES: 30S ribosomal protein S8 [Mycoplasmatota]ADM21847.1 30S ribosomal protein S8 [Mesomycoplasma hyorhinis HUB-1]AEC46334.1 30S ribosomal protein S8 [Mesomycoplasma hyorhinis MCLD]AEX14172.1 ribosomal protein S8 [Mesomycoplasma hyorhinis GDL-1]AFX74358.1 SSU ribosomal protein S8p (S15Ae) [Mesomycoplasma hyorhinis SK76]AHA41171.1 30S ribosomal S8 family protein [Mesomycoplasma hyorhinis DBS 1050]